MVVSLLVALVSLGFVAPAPTDPVVAPEPAAPSPPAPAPAPVYGPLPPGHDPALEAHLAQNWQFAAAVQQRLREDLMDEWQDYVEEEREKAEERAEGDDEPPASFDDYMRDKYRGKRRTGITLTALGFIPLVVGGVLAVAAEEPLLMMVGVGSIPMWVAGGVTWGVGQGRLDRYQDASYRVYRGGRVARWQFRGLRPLVGAARRTGGLSLTFAF